MSSDTQGIQLGNWNIRRIAPGVMSSNRTLVNHAGCSCQAHSRRLHLSATMRGWLLRAFYSGLVGICPILRPDNPSISCACLLCSCCSNNRSRAVLPMSIKVSLPQYGDLEEIYMKPPENHGQYAKDNQAASLLASRDGLWHQARWKAVVFKTL